MNEIAWSPSCNTLVVSAQDSTLTFVNTSTNDKVTTTLNLESTPITKLVFIDDKSFIGIAFDRHAYLFENDSDKWYNLCL